MTKRTRRLAIVLVAAWILGAPSAFAEPDSGPTLKVLTFNVWHGLRGGESKKRFPSEEGDRKSRRFDWQIEEIKRHDPDVLLLQEVNPNQREARKYAHALGYDEIHKVTSCGIHLGKLYKLPRNVNEGLAILARPELGLKRVGWKRLSGNAWCTASFGFQTRESRFVLFGTVELGGRRVLLANTHLYSPAYMPRSFRDGLEELVAEGVVAAEQRDEILGILDDRLARHVGEVEALYSEIERRARKTGAAAVILGGDFNAEPGTRGLRTLKDNGMISATADRQRVTWDPVTNRVNYRIGTKQSEPVPTFGIQELIDLMAPRRTDARQIDHLFVTLGLAVTSARRVLDQPLGGIFPSDHYGLLAEIELGARPAECNTADPAAFNGATQ